MTPEGVSSPRKVLHKKLLKDGRREYMIEISKTRSRYYIASVLMTRSRQVQMLDFTLKQAKKLLEECGDVVGLAERVEFQHGELTVRDLQKLLYQTVDPVEHSARRRNIPEQSPPRMPDSRTTVPFSPVSRRRVLADSSIGLSPGGGREGETTTEEVEGRTTGVGFGEEEEEKKEEPVLEPKVELEAN